MSNKLIETFQPTQDALIEEHPSTTKYLWSFLKQHPHKRIWLTFFACLLGFPLVLPYVFFGSHTLLYIIGLFLLSVTAGYLLTNWGFSKPPTKIEKLVTLFLSLLVLSLGFKLLNLDKNILVDYRERVADFPYDVIDKEFSDVSMRDDSRFTIKVESESILNFGPDFDSLGSTVARGKSVYIKPSIQEFKPFTIYYGSDAQGKTGDIRGKRTVYGWFGSTSTDFVIKLER